MAAIAVKSATKPKALPEKFGAQPVRLVRFHHPMPVTDLGKAPIHGGIIEWKASDGLLLTEAPDGSLWFSGKTQGRVPIGSIKYIEYV